MSTHACTRIQDGADYIELHSPTGTETEDVKQLLKNQTDYWKNFVQSLQDDILKSDFDFSSLLQWSQDFEEFLKMNQYFPSIDNVAALMSMQDFTGHHLMPYYNLGSKELLDYWGYNNPDLTATMKPNTFSFSGRKKNFDLQPKAVNKKEFKIVRIKTWGGFENYVHLDLKVHEFDKKEFLFTVLSLPEFWRNFHFVSRKKVSEGAIDSPAYELNKKLFSFYNPAQGFSTNTIIPSNKKQIIKNLQQEAPFKLYVNSLAMHLMFRMPGLVLPMTTQEQMWSAEEKPDMEIQLIFSNADDGPLMCIEYSDDRDLVQQLFTEFSETFSQREQSFSSFYEIGPYQGGYYLLTKTHEFAYLYESNMVELFDSLSKFDKQTN